MDTEVKNINEEGYDWTEQVAPHPVKEGSRSWHLYDILSSLGGKATLTEIWRMAPASDLDPKPKNKQQLRDWIGQSGTSKGYTVKIKKDHYRIATLEEYEAVFQKNKASVRKYRARRNRQAARAAAKAMPTVQKEITLKPPVQDNTLREKAKESVLRQRAWAEAKKEAKEELAVERKDVSSPSSIPLPTPNTPFVNQYLGSLIGTSVAIVLFYLVTKLLG
jgi:hypothetical protein